MGNRPERSTTKTRRSTEVTADASEADDLGSAAGERLVAAGRHHEPFSIDAVEPSLARDLRRMVRKVRVAGVVVSLAGDGRWRFLVDSDRLRQIVEATRCA
jgi:hypothetical protein